MLLPRNDPRLISILAARNHLHQPPAIAAGPAGF
jgi:hypothetical protein